MLGPLTVDRFGFAPCEYIELVAVNGLGRCDLIPLCISDKRANRFESVWVPDPPGMAKLRPNASVILKKSVRNIVQKNPSTTITRWAWQRGIVVVMNQIGPTPDFIRHR